MKADPQLAPVSVVIPCYRCAETIGRAFDSIVRQTLLPREVLLVEDCSNDKGETIDRLKELQRKYDGIVGSVTVIQSEKNGGPAAARNAGWNQAREPFVAFLDADDAWHPKKIEIQYKWMELHREAALTAHSSLHIQPGDPPPELPGEWKFQPVGRLLLLLSNKLPTRSVMLRRDIACRFDPAKRHSEDYLLWLRIVLGGHKAYRFQVPLAYSYKADFGAGGLSKDLWKMEIGELDAYRQLYVEGMISRVVFTCVAFTSLMKFLRRLFLVFLSRGLRQ